MKTRNLFILLAAVIAVSLPSCTGGNGSTYQWQEEIDNAEIVPLLKVSDNDENALKIVYVDADGKQVINREFERGDYFHDGLALVSETREESGTGLTVTVYGYIDKKGNFAIEPRYVSAGDFSDGVAFVADKDSCVMAIDTSGKEIFRVPQARLLSILRGDYASYMTITGEYGLIDKKGQTVKTPGFIDGSNLREQVIAGDYVYIRVGTLDGKLYKIKNLEMTETPVSEKFGVEGWNPEAKLAIIKQGDQYGLADENGEIKVNPQYSRLVPDNKLFVYRNEKNKYGWIDGEGNEVIQAKYKEVTPFGQSDYAAVSTSGSKYQIINRQGETVISAKYERIRPATGNLFFVKNDAGWGIADAGTGEIVCKPQFEDIARSGKVLIATSGENKWGVIDATGKYLSGFDFNVPAPGYTMELGTYSQNNGPEVMAEFIQHVATKALEEEGMTVRELIDRYNTSESDILGTYDGVPPIATWNFGDNFIGLYANFDGSPVKYTGYRYTPRLNAEVKAVSFEVNFTAPGDMVKRVADIGMSKYGWKLNENATAQLSQSTMLSVAVEKGKSFTITPNDMVDSEEFLEDDYYEDVFQPDDWDGNNKTY